jgi:hypothetical protein
MSNIQDNHNLLPYICKLNVGGHYITSPKIKTLKTINKHLHIKSKCLKQWDILPAKSAVSHTTPFPPTTLIEKHPDIQTETLYQVM